MRAVDSPGEHGEQDVGASERVDVSEEGGEVGRAGEDRQQAVEAVL